MIRLSRTANAATPTRSSPSDLLETSYDNPALFADSRPSDFTGSPAVCVVALVGRRDRGVATGRAGLGPGRCVRGAGRRPDSDLVQPGRPHATQGHVLHGRGVYRG